MAHRMQFLSKNVALVFATHTTVATSTIALNGFLRGVKVKTPAAVTSSATTTVTIADASGDVIFTKSAVAVNTTTQDYLGASSIPLELPVAGNYTITTTYSAAQDANRTTTVTLLVESLI